MSDWVHKRQIMSAVLQALREAGFTHDEALPIALKTCRKLGLGKIPLDKGKPVDSMVRVLEERHKHA